MHLRFVMPTFFIVLEIAMNIQQAKGIPLAVILNILGCLPRKTYPQQTIYPSLFATRKSDELVVNTVSNTWYDSSTQKSGTAIDLVTAYLQREGENHTAKDALRWLTNMCGYARCIEPIDTSEKLFRHKNWFTVDAAPLRLKSLIAYLESQGIPLIQAQRYLKEVRIYNKKEGKTIRIAGLRNEDGGYYLCHPDFQGMVGKENITFIRGTVTKPEGIHIFKDVFDFLSVIVGLQTGIPFREDVIILNCFQYLPKATPYIKGYGYQKAYSWMPNTSTGKRATKSLSRFLTTEPHLLHFRMNGTYKAHEKPHAWHLQQTFRSIQ
jgi:hypothetical protein